MQQRRIISILIVFIFILLPVTFATANTIHFGGGAASGGLTVTVNGGSLTIIMGGGGGSPVDQDTDNIPKLDEPSVAELYSVNNHHANALFKPLLEDIPGLASYVSSGYANIYDKSFDHAYGNGVTARMNNPSRPLEILGYDAILDNERWVYGGGSTEKDIGRGWRLEQSVTPMTNVKQITAIMNTYKALGREFYRLEKQTISTNKDNTNSPATQNLPGLWTEVNVSHIEIASTRSYADDYLGQAGRDRVIATTGFDKSSGITLGEFIVMVQYLMELYGEPVMSDQEVYLLLQSYGSQIPTGLPTNQRDAYIYLKSRGILEVTTELNSPLSRNDMLDILMRVKDKESRTTFKEIGITTTPSELVELGYFPDAMDIVQMSNNTDIGVDVEYDYRSATKYDYLVLKTDRTSFKNSSGGEITNLYVPSNYNDPNSGIAANTGYVGIVRDDVGREYYHFIIDRSVPTVNGHILIRPNVATERPKELWLQAGGGVYTATSNYDLSSVRMPRTPFRENAYPAMVDSERWRDGRGGIALFVQKVLEELIPSVYAVGSSNTTSGANATNNVQSTVVYSQYTWEHMSNAVQQSVIAKYGNPVQRPDGAYTFSTSNSAESSELTSLAAADLSGSKESRYAVMSSLKGSYLVKFADLVDKGLFSYDAPVGTNKKIEPRIGSNGVMTLHSRFGDVKIVVASRQIIVGNVIYKIPKDVELFTIKDGALYVDVRVAYGYGDSYYEYTVAGTSDFKALSIVPKDYQADKLYRIDSMTTIGRNTLNSTSKSNDMYVNVIKKNINGNWYAAVRINSFYPLANYAIYCNPTGSMPKDYLFIAYPKDQLSNPAVGLSADQIEELDSDANQELFNLLGYNLESEKYAIKVFDVNNSMRTGSSIAGHLMYDEYFGYIYILPNGKSFKYPDYFKTTAATDRFLLPLIHNVGSSDSLKVSDYVKVVSGNLNRYGGIAYGYQWSETGEFVPFNGTKTAKSASKTVFSDMTIAPTALTAYIGTYQRSYRTVESVFKSREDMGNIFLGTEPVTIRHQTGNNYILLSDKGGANQYVVTGDTRLVNVGSQLMQNATRYQINNVYVVEGNGFNTSEETKSRLLFDLGSLLDGTPGIDWRDLQFQDLVKLVNKIAGIITGVAFHWIPLIGLAAVTILLGLTFISDAALVRAIFNRWGDPIKILSGGELDVNTITVYRMLFYLMLVWIVFALCLDGNIIRIIEWVTTAFNSFIDRFVT